ARMENCPVLASKFCVMFRVKQTLFGLCFAPEPSKSVTSSRLITLSANLLMLPSISLTISVFTSILFPYSMIFLFSLLLSCVFAVGVRSYLGNGAVQIARSNHLVQQNDHPLARRKRFWFCLWRCADHSRPHPLLNESSSFAAARLAISF